MLRIRFAVATLLLTLALGSFAETRVSPELLDRLARGERVRVVVALREQVRRAEPRVRRVRIASLQDDVLQQVSNDFAIDARWRNIAAFSGELSIGSLHELASHPDVVAISEDRGGTIAMNESAALIGVPAVHERGFTGEGATVAVIDTGIDVTHPDFAGRIVAQHCYCRDARGKGCCPNLQPTQSGAGAARDDHGHGTNVTGIIASGGAVAPKGIAPKASIVSLRVTDHLGYWWYSSQLISALDAVINDYPEVRVVNISLGTSQIFASACDQASAEAIAVASAIRTLRARGTAVFAASGNAASSEGITFPACLDEVISVGAVYDAPGTYASSLCESSMQPDAITCFSNIGPTLDLLAPGASITSSGRRGSMSTFGGTSQASPHAAGAAALVFAIKPALTVTQLETLMRNTGTSIVDARNGVSVPRINVDRAVTELTRTGTHRKRRSVSH